MVNIKDNEPLSAEDCWNSMGTQFPSLMAWYLYQFEEQSRLAQTVYAAVKEGCFLFVDVNPPWAADNDVEINSLPIGKFRTTLESVAIDFFLVTQCMDILSSCETDLQILIDSGRPPVSIVRYHNRESGLYVMDFVYAIRQ